MTDTPTDTPTDPGDLQADIDSARNELAQLRTHVRDAILKQHQTGAWCLPGTNDALRDLDLEPITFSYTGRITLNVDVTIHAATDLDEVVDILNQTLTVDANDDTVDVLNYALDRHATHDLSQQAAR